MSLILCYRDYTQTNGVLNVMRRVALKTDTVLKTSFRAHAQCSRALTRRTRKAAPRRPTSAPSHFHTQKKRPPLYGPTAVHRVQVSTMPLLKSPVYICTPPRHWNRRPKGSICVLVTFRFRISGNSQISVLVQLN